MNMASNEPKSGKLYKLGHGLFGPKWTEKWVHLDGHVLKYFSMASEQQPMFSLTSARQSYAIELACYDFVLTDDKRITRKHAFHLVPKNKTAKAYVFACNNERELSEWQEAFQPRADLASDTSLSPTVAEKIRRASDAFTAGDISEYSLLQQQLDPNVEGKISRESYLRVVKQYFLAREKQTTTSSYVEKSCSSQSEPSVKDTGGGTPRTSFSDRPPRYPKRSEMSEPEIVSEIDPSGSNHDGDEVTTNDATSTAAQAAAAVHAPYSPQGQSGEEESVREWQREFHQLLYEPQPQSDDQLVPRGLEMATVITEFRREAERATQEIVAEIALDDDARTIPSVALDDDQFFATDYSSDLETVRQQVTKFMWRGLLVYITHDESVHKLFGHELRAAKALHAAIAEQQASVAAVATHTQLVVPLQCIVDYLGFRALIFAMPRVGSPRMSSSRMLTTLSGSASQERTRQQLKSVYSDLGIFVEDLDRESTRRLDQMPDFVGKPTGMGMYSASSASHDSVRVLHNVLDTFPEDPLPQGSDANNSSSSVATLQRFRPEFVAQHGSEFPLFPVSVTTTANTTATQAALFQSAALSANEHLCSVVVPAFVAFVETHSTHIYDSASLTAALHREGINVRYLGLCYEMAATKHAKKLFWCEMIARACKKELRASLQAVFQDTADDVRRLVRAGSVSAVNGEDEESEQLFTGADLHTLSRDVVVETTRRVVAAFFNLVFSVGSPDTHTFWVDLILPRIQRQFVVQHHDFLTMEPGTLLHESHTHWPQVYQAVQYHTGVTVVNPIASISFTSTLPFGDATTLVLDIQPRSKLICRTTHECERLFVARAADDVSAVEALESVKTQIAIHDAAPCDDKTLSLGHLFIAAAELSLCENQIDQADAFAALAVEAATVNLNGAVHARALLSQLRVGHAQDATMEELSALFTEAVGLATQHLGAVHPFLFDFHMTMMEIATARGDHAIAKQCFSDAALLVKDCYGRSSVAYADIRRRQGEALLQSQSYDEAMSVLDEALAVYERIQQDHKDDYVDFETIQEIHASCASCLYLTADLQARQSTPNALEIAFSTAVRAYKIREQALPMDHTDRLSSLLQLGELCVALGDAYRALEYYRPALAKLQAMSTSDDDDGDDDQIASQLSKVSHAVLGLHLRSLPAEKQTLVDRTKKRFADAMSTFEGAISLLQGDTTQRTPSGDTESKLLRFVMRQLIEQDPVEYVNQLIAKTDQELQAQRRQSFVSGTTMRRESAAEDPMSSPLRSPVVSPSGSSRFASFAFGQPPQHAARPSSPLPLLHPNGLALSPLQRSSSGSSFLESSPLLVPGGGFTYGSQLAAVVFLASLDDQAYV